MTKKLDAYDLWHEWANKPLQSPLMISDEIYNAVMAMPESDRDDREKVNAAVRAASERELPHKQ